MFTPADILGFIEVVVTSSRFVALLVFVGANVAAPVSLSKHLCVAITLVRDKMTMNAR